MYFSELNKSFSANNRNNDKKREQNRQNNHRRQSRFAARRRTIRHLRSRMGRGAAQPSRAGRVRDDAPVPRRSGPAFDQLAGVLGRTRHAGVADSQHDGHASGRVGRFRRFVFRFFEPDVRRGELPSRPSVFPVHRRPPRFATHGRNVRTARIVVRDDAPYL